MCVCVCVCVCVFNFGQSFFNNDDGFQFSLRSDSIKKRK